MGHAARAAGYADPRRVNARTVRLILDASAIVAFTRGSIDVGETIAEVNDEPVVALQR